MILTYNEVKKMREELDRDLLKPKINPPQGREYWDVFRIVETLEHYQQTLRKIKNIISININN